jgi:RND family efflux transporter MFP subunit
MLAPEGAGMNPQAGPDLSGLKIDDHARQRGGSRKWLRWIGPAFLLILILSAAAFTMLGRTPVVEVTSATVPKDDREVLLNASGYVTPQRRATVAAKITGQVLQLHVEEGLHVKEGQVLAVLDTSDARVRLNSARADRDATRAALEDLHVQLANADRELKRSRALHQSGVISAEALDTAQTTDDSLRAKIALTQQQVEAADERIRVAQQDFDNCTVRAPFSGIIVSKDAQVGEMVSPISAGGGFTRTGIATLVDMNSLEIEVDVNESYIARVKNGMPVEAVLDAYPDWKIPAKVRTVIPTADRQKATVKVRITFNHLDPRILPDMGVKVTFLGDEPKKQAQAAPIVLVPQGALRNEGASKIVFVYHDGKIERRAVRLGGTRGSDQEIIAGLNGGDQVVVTGPNGLRDGDRVQVKQ